MCKNLTLTLLIIVIIVIVIDIIMALCLRTVLPRYVMYPSTYYKADGHKLPFEEAVQECPCLEGVFVNGTKQVIAFNPVPMQKFKLTRRTKKLKDHGKSTTPMSTKSKRSIEENPHYNFLVAIVNQLYSSTSSQLSCNGIVVGRRTLITLEKCLNDNPHFINLVVLCNFKEHYVESYTPFNNDSQLVSVKVYPDFPEHIKIPKLAWNNNWTDADLLTWNRQVTGIDVEKWTRAPCLQPRNITRKPSCGTMTTNFLISDRKRVLGVEMQDCAEFYGFTMPEDDDHRLVYEDSC